jgi:hypothetical protein
MCSPTPQFEPQNNAISIVKFPACYDPYHPDLFKISLSLAMSTWPRFPKLHGWDQVVLRLLGPGRSEDGRHHPYKCMKDIKIIYAVFAGSMIRAGAGKQAINYFHFGNNKGRSDGFSV